MSYQESLEKHKLPSLTRQQLVEQHQLGRSFGPPYKYRTAYQFVAMMVLVVTGAGLLLPLWLILDWTFGELSLKDTSGISFGSVASVVFGLIAWALLWFGIKGCMAVYRRRGTAMYLYKEGLIIALNGDKHVVVRWDQVNSLWQEITRQYVNGIPSSTTYLYRIRTLDQREYIFGNNIRDIADMGQILSREITGVLLPKVATAYDAGETVAFGKFRINQQGIAQGEKVLPWEEVAGVEVEAGKLLVKKRGQWLNWASAPVSDIPNALVLIALVNVLLEQRRGSSRKGLSG